MVTLKEKYANEISVTLKEKLGLKNTMEVPCIDKVVINMGIGNSVSKDEFRVLVSELAQLAGQAPKITLARQSISNFRLREGNQLGAKVTLRGNKMYEFLDRFIHCALPRIRDFRGIPRKGFDGRGNYNLGITDQIIFPELDPDAIKVTQGMDVAFVTTAKNDDEARTLLELVGLPFAEAK